ncbi:MAG: multiprotein-bridging factor 1 family protein [Candidatus Saccharimonadia bacterium]
MRIPDRTVGETIRISRIRLGLTQQQLANKLNEELASQEIIERSMISRWEKDLHFPRNARKDALEKHLGITLGNPPLKRDSFAAYSANQLEISKSIEKGLETCDELWITNVAGAPNIWNDLPVSRKIFEKLRKSQACQFRELIYVHDLEGLKAVENAAKSAKPRYRIRVRVSPGHPLPILLAPNKKFGLFLSGFNDDIANVGLELNGQIAGFIEHYFRHLWDRATPILESDGIQEQNIIKIRNALNDFGGSLPTKFNGE